MLAFAEVGQDPVKPPSTKQGEQVTRVLDAAVLPLPGIPCDGLVRKAHSQAGVEEQIVNLVWVYACMGICMISTQP